MDVKQKIEKRYKRHKRIKAKIIGTKERPRLCVFSSNRHVYAQLIDDEKHRTMTMASDLEIKKTKSKKIEEKTGKEDSKTGVQIRKGKIAPSYEVGKLIAQKAKELKISKVVFDRAGYKYHGRIKALAEGAREGGLKF